MFGESTFSEITITLLPNDMVRLRSTLLGRFDSSYAPLTQERLAVELTRLLSELRAGEADQLIVFGSKLTA